MDRGFFIALQVMRRQLGAMPCDYYQLCLIHGVTRKPFPGEQVVDDVVVGLMIDQDIAGISSSREGTKEDVITFTIAPPDKADHGAACELESGRTPCAPTAM